MLSEKAVLSPRQPLTHVHNVCSIKEENERMGRYTEESNIQELQEMSEKSDAAGCNACWE